MTRLDYNRLESIDTKVLDLRAKRKTWGHGDTLYIMGEQSVL